MEGNGLTTFAQGSAAKEDSLHVGGLVSTCSPLPLGQVGFSLSVSHI